MFQSFNNENIMKSWTYRKQQEIIDAIWTMDMGAMDMRDDLRVFLLWKGVVRETITVDRMRSWEKTPTTTVKGKGLRGHENVNDLGCKRQAVRGHEGDGVRLCGREKKII